MSLRSYLFILMGCLIAVITVSQLVLINWIESNLAKEVDKQARQYSERIIELAVDKLGDIEHTTKVDANQPEKNNSTAEAHIKIIAVKERTSDFSEELANKAVNKSSDHDVHDSANQTINTQVIKQEFKALVSQLHQQQSHELTQHIKDQKVFISSPNKVTHTWITGTPDNNSSKQLFNRIQWALILVGTLGLLFAYWLSIQFNKPLKQLTYAFHRLANGDYQHKVKVQGVTEIRQTMAQFNQMVERLQQLTTTEQQHKEMSHLAELGEVSRGLAHALRNPIHTIGLAIEQLNEKALSAQQKQSLLSTMQDKIANIDKNIKALLTLTTSGICRNENVPLLAVVQDIILEYKSSVNKELIFEVNIDAQCNIQGAESEIRSIIHTLINNACDANDEGARVNITADCNSPGQVEVVITDQGRGLKPDIEQQLFQPHISSKPEGAGMGLYIAQRLISLHYQGSITLKNMTKNQQIIGCLAKANFRTSAHD